MEVPENVYYPQEDSLLLAKALDGIDVKGKRALEVGCGSGLLSIIMAKSGADVTAVDINEEAVETAKINASDNEADINCFVSDLFSNVSGVFDMIIFNPPYLPVEPGENDPTYAGGTTGRDTIEMFIAGVKEHLKLDGTVLLLISSLTGEEEVVKLFEKEGMATRSIAREKIPWEELIVIEACL